MNYFLKLLAISALTISVSIPAFAEDETLNKKAKDIRKQGIYGKSSIDLSEDQKKKKPEPNKPNTLSGNASQYNLSITPHTEVVQNSHHHLLKGEQLYLFSKKLFNASYKITSDFDKTKNTVTVTFKALIGSGVKASEILKYGENAYIALRLRGLQKSAATLQKSLSHINEAGRLVPLNLNIQKWQKSLRNVQKIIDFHIEFNKIILRSDSLGLTKEHLSYLAQMWSINVPIGPDDIIEEKFFSKVKLEDLFKDDSASDKDKPRGDGDLAPNELPKIDDKVKHKRQIK